MGSPQQACSNRKGNAAVKTINQIMKHNSTTYKLLTAVCAMMFFLVAGRQEAHAQQVGVKTNALMWAAMTPNAGCEVVIGEHSSLDLSVFGHYKPYGMQSELLAFQPEFRYWFNGRPMIREYLGVSSMIAGYDMNISNYVYNGNAASLGLTGGYVFLLGKRWRLDLCGGFSFLFFFQKQYYETDDYYVDKDISYNSWGYKLFPAKLGVSFTYIIR